MVIWQWVVHFASLHEICKRTSVPAPCSAFFSFLCQCIIHVYFTFTALTSDADERQSLCAGEIVIFTCEVRGVGILKWGINPYVDIDHDPIRFRLRDNVNVGHKVFGTDGLYNATVTSVSHDPTIPTLGNLTSELSVLAVLGQRIRVLCEDGVTGRRSAVMPPTGTVGLVMSIVIHCCRCHLFLPTTHIFHLV